MKRAALERPLMEKRMREDVKKHGTAPCNCSPGRFRKRRPWGCPNGRGCGVCGREIRRQVIVEGLLAREDPSIAHDDYSELWA